MQKHSSKVTHLNFSSQLQTRTNTIQLSHSYLRSSKNSQYLGDKSRMSQAANENCKMIKLIGDKQNNIEEIIAQVHCICGGKKQIKNILSLLMTKIYRLRQQRNAAKQKLEACEAELSKLRNKCTVGVNTDAFLSSQVPSFLATQIQTNNEANNSQNKAEFSKLQQLFQTEGAQSMTFQRDFNESNLLEESEVKMNANLEESSLLQLQELDSKGKKVLGQHCPQNRLGPFSQFLKVNKFDLNTLQSYIQKVNCAKQIGKYQLRRRNKDLF